MATRTFPASGPIIPEAIQEPIRRRFRLMRIAKGIKTHAFAAAHSGTIAKMELHDISSAKLSTLYLASRDLSEDFGDFMRYLVGEDAEAASVPDNIRRISVLMRGMSEADQRLVLDIVRLVIASRTGPRELVATTDRRSAREILAEMAQAQG